MNLQVQEAFTSAAVVALQEMAGMEAGPGEARPEDGPMPGDLFAEIRLLRDAPGVLSLAFPQAVIREIARRYLGEKVALDAVLLGDAAGELANVIAGQAKTMLQGTDYHFRLSTPRSGSVAPPAGDGVLLPIGTEAGEFLLRVELPPCAEAG